MKKIPSPLALHLANLSLVYWLAQCALGFIALTQGTFHPTIFLGAAIIGGIPVIVLSHTLFFKRAAGLARKSWGLRCALALFLQLGAATFTWYEPGSTAAILWAAATVLLTFVVFACRHFIAKV